MARHLALGGRDPRLAALWRAVLVCALGFLIAAPVSGAPGTSDPLGAEHRLGAVPLEPGTPGYEALRQRLLDIGMTEAEAASVLEFAMADGNADFFSPFGGDADIQPPQADIIAGVTFEAMLTQEFYDRFPMGCDEPGLLCPHPIDGAPAPGAPLPPPGEFYVYQWAAPETFVFEDAGEQAFFEAGISYFDETPLNGEPAERWVANPQFPNDFFQGHNTAYSFRFDAQAPSGTLFRLGYLPSEGQFLAEETSGFGIYGDGVLSAFIPEEEWDGAVDYRTFGFMADNTEGQFAVASDTLPDIDEPAAVVTEGGFPIVELPSLATPEPTPAATPAAPVETPGATATEAPVPAAPDVPAVTDAGIPLWLFVLVLVTALLLLLGGWFWWLRRPDRPTGTTARAIDAGAAPIGATAAGIHATAAGINATASSINSTVEAINRHASAINRTAGSIIGHVSSINSTAEAITAAVSSINSTAEAITQDASAIIRATESIPIPTGAERASEVEGLTGDHPEWGSLVSALSTASVRLDAAEASVADWAAAAKASGFAPDAGAPEVPPAVTGTLTQVAGETARVRTSLESWADTLRRHR